MKKLVSLLIAATAILAVGCGDDDDIDDDIIIEEPPDDIPPPPDDFIELTANIVGFGPYSTLSGVGRVVLDSPTSFSAEIEIRNDLPGAVRPWHVHFGGCPGGAIVGPLESYRDVLIDGSGTGAVSTVVNSPFDLNLVYSINVHNSPADFTIIACGELF